MKPFQAAVLAMVLVAIVVLGFYVLCGFISTSRAVRPDRRLVGATS